MFSTREFFEGVLRIMFFDERTEAKGIQQYRANQRNKERGGKNSLAIFTN
ncbi:hypothetical protein KY362_07925 [Candidatus Woesearchaeota archaeon]|nr:hypothetical protein [Candidatus Woesearchaeota archaeon]